MWRLTFFLIFACYQRVANCLEAKCQTSSADTSKPCINDITAWSNADPDHDPYNCAAGPPYTPDEAAALCNSNDSGCSRIRRNLYSVVNNPELLHVVMKALYCAHWRSRQNGGELIKIDEYKENQWVLYII